MITAHRATKSTCLKVLNAKESTSASPKSGAIGPTPQVWSRVPVRYFLIHSGLITEMFEVTARIFCMCTLVPVVYGPPMSTPAAPVLKTWKNEPPVHSAILVPHAGACSNGAGTDIKRRRLPTCACRTCAEPGSGNEARTSNARVRECRGFCERFD